MTGSSKLENSTSKANNVIVLPIKQRVLIVDDDAINRQIWEEMLSGVCSLAFAENGEVALQIYESFRPGLVVLDRMMPGMHGDDVLKKIRKLDSTGETKIVMHSMLEKAADQIDGMRKGADLYIPKSIDMEVAVTQVQSLLEMQKSSHSSSLFKVAREQLRKDTYSSNLIAKGIFRHAALISENFRARKVNITSIAKQAAQKIREKTGASIDIYEEKMTSSGMIFGERDFLNHAFEMTLKRACDVSEKGVAVHMCIRKANGHYIVAIEDKGPTIPLEERRNIFHFNCDARNLRIALPVAWETAQRHLGDLTLTDGRNGMCLTFTFPTAEQLVKEKNTSH